ncbi:LytTR family DNA-binding domain-containing protein [Erysipelothrix urinaevulpis]|uniref:LytR/AlgR family response regulator transcription factor n=1 Tax=Erysipelothrix urinaevulpis TaxID=2683717 RepID=UPI00135C8E10|nr:LytTR family DNA-binding domain-containing protein [Erysipelothrix urinaevulpis]
MRVQLAKDIDENEIKESLDKIEIVEDGEYMLIRKAPRLPVYNDDGDYFIDVFSIDYVEAYGNEISVYSQSKKYRTNYKLYEIIELSTHFLRINKSVVINQTKIKEIKPSMNMKFKVLVGDQWLDVNRHYYYKFKDTIGI